MKHFNWLVLLTALFCTTTLQAQYAEVYPTNWWVGMKKNTVQLLIKGNYAGFSKEKVSVNYPGVSLGQTNSFENGKYIAVDITIAPEAKLGMVNLVFENKKGRHIIQWELKARREGNGTKYAQGVTSSDIIYLLIADRFSNGDLSNDHVAGMKDQTLNRDSIYHRHGGDLQGVLNHVDYLQDMGASSLWMLPILENDMFGHTEHGYAITNHYKIDPRLGDAKLHKKLSDELHKRGMKLIQDVVYNHVGLYHFLVQDAPSKDWMHQWPAFTQTNYRFETHIDPYASESDKKQMTDGWFVPEMPDWNHSNPFVVNFIIQHAIWYVEEFGVDGIRIDTYMYSDLNFANACNKALLDEFPKLTLFGESMIRGQNQAYFSENILDTKFKSNLAGAVDFHVYYSGIIPALTEKDGWESGVHKLYSALANDYLYKDPMQNVLCVENHDLSGRIFSMVGDDVRKQKMAYQWLFTCRGIPQMYYGSEVLMKGFNNPDGWLRLDFPGGWDKDKKNAFTGAGLTSEEADVQSFIKKMAKFRNSSSALKTGKMMHYIPKESLYVYFRYDDKQTIMCVMNTGDSEKEVDFTKFAERTSGFSKAKNVNSDKESSTAEKLKVAPMQMLILELNK